MTHPSPACHTTTATQRPWLASDIAEARNHAWRVRYRGETAPVVLRDENRVCKGWAGLDPWIQDGCAGCARIPEVHFE